MQTNFDLKMQKIFSDSLEEAFEYSNFLEDDVIDEVVETSIVLPKENLFDSYQELFCN